MERTVIPNPTQELGIKQIPILAPLEVKKLTPKSTSDIVILTGLGSHS